MTLLEYAGTIDEPRIAWIARIRSAARLTAIAACMTFAVLGQAEAFAAKQPDLRERYATLEQRYRAAERSGADVKQLDPLIDEIAQAKRREDASKLAPLLDQLDAELSRLEAGTPDTFSGSGTTAGMADLGSVAACPSAGAATADRAWTGEHTLAQAVGGRQAYADLLRFRAADGLVADNGAAARNIGTFSDVAAQRDALWVLLRGVREKSQSRVDLAVLAMEYAFDRQDPAGYFENGRGVDPRTAVGADAFFLQAFARVFLIVRDSAYCAGHLDRLSALLPRLQLAMNWLGTDSNTAELFRQDQQTANRLLFDANAFLLNGMLLGDDQLVATGERFLEAALALQAADGAFGEHGGSDTSYQAVSLLNLTVLHSYLSLSPLRDRIYEAVARGAGWESMRIRADGRVAVEDNTRTGLGQEEFLGKEKEVNYPEVALALYYASGLLKEPALSTQADHVVAYMLKARGYQ